MPTAQQLLAEKQRIEGLISGDRNSLAFLKRSLAAAQARGAPANQLFSRQIEIENRERAIRSLETNLARVEQQITAANTPTTSNPPNPQVPPAPAATPTPAPTTTTASNPPNPQVPPAPAVTPAPTNTAASQTTDFTFEDNASLGYSSPPAAQSVSPTQINAQPQTVTDTGGVPTQSLADIDGDTGFVPQPEPEPVPEGFSPYGEQDEPFDPDFRSAPDPALFTEEYVQEQDNPVDGIDYNINDELSPYGEENDPLDPVPVIDPFEADGIGYGSAETEFEADNPNLVTLEAPDPYEIDGANIGLTEEEIQQQDNPIDAVQQQATLQQARAQQILRDQQKQANQGDWRVKLRLAPGANYLYDDPNDPGILAPLSTSAGTGGVVFPYTPQIVTSYNAKYDSYDLTHSNYRGYFYQGSHVGDIQINATFTAQDSVEAAYLLAVIHFFRSVTKMFYGLDPQRGAPPPLVFLEGMGQFQFNRHPCVVSQFNYNLPADVDYIRANSPNISSTNLLFRRTRQDLPTNAFSSAWTRLKNSGLFPGATVGNNSGVNVPTFGKNSPTYVPTKIDISLILLPMQTRQQVSQQFSLKEFSNGKLIQKGFW